MPTCIYVGGREGGLNAHMYLRAKERGRDC